MEICKAKTVAFTGHRSLGNKTPLEVHKEVRKAIMELYNQGYTTFLTGMAEGFDLIAGMAVIEAKDNHPEIKLIAVIPFEKQAQNFSVQSQRMYDAVLRNSNYSVVLSEFYYKDLFLRRNDYLLENSSAVICYYSGQRGGTMYTYNRAKKAGKYIKNIFKDAPSLF